MATSSTTLTTIAAAESHTTTASETSQHVHDQGECDAKLIDLVRLLLHLTGLVLHFSAIALLCL